ncbi:MAG: aminopeptidase P family N-terminal domain-containing protein, partial [Intestinibacter bartlettii]|uniref:aminopeptidase P family N-terminal domain-containing protein n=1 Tax=Intestinibacter bartlettii TaxID=261299 RepID=UPI0026E96062
MIKDKLKKLRESMKHKGIYAYIIPSADFHQSEYVGDYFKCRQFISGFTGSAGTVVVTLDEAGLWTDGRYFIQAE